MLKEKPHFANFKPRPWWRRWLSGPMDYAMVVAYPWLKEIWLKCIIIKDEILELIYKTTSPSRTLRSSTCCPHVTASSLRGLAAVAANNKFGFFWLCLALCSLYFQPVRKQEKVEMENSLLICWDWLVYALDCCVWLLRNIGGMEKCKSWDFMFMLVWDFRKVYKKYMVFLVLNGMG